MSDRKFTWLASQQLPRRGPTLETGKEYSVADFGEGVVAVWVRAGDAKYITERKARAFKEE